MLEIAWENTSPAANSLRSQLRAYENEARSALATGQIASVSQNSVSHSYASGSDILSSLDVARGWRELVNLFDRSLEVLGTAGRLEGVEDVDELVHPEMKARLIEGYRCEARITYLRCHA